MLAEAKKEFKSDLEQLRKHASLKLVNEKILEKSFDLDSWYSAFLIKYEVKQETKPENGDEDKVVPKKTGLGDFESKKGWQDRIKRALLYVLRKRQKKMRAKLASRQFLLPHLL